MISTDRKLIRRNSSESGNILARINNLQIIMNHDVKSRLCAGSTVRINLDYILDSFMILKMTKLFLNK